MRTNLMFTLTLAFCSVATAQQSNTPQWEIYGGYQYTRVGTGFVQDELDLLHTNDPAIPPLPFGRHQNMSGWNFGAQENLNNWFGGVADVSGSYKTNYIDLGAISNVKGTVRTRIRLYTMMAGPQFTLRTSSTVQPFARVLLGGAFPSASVNGLANNVPLFPEQSTTDSGFAVAGGGGTDFFFSNHVGLRVSVDYIRAYAFGQSLNNFRGNAGVVFRFGSK